MGTTFAIIMTLICIFFFVCSVIYRNNNTDKRYVLYGGREFYCYCEGAFGGKMCCVNIYEYFPNKIFKNKYRDTKSFWINDYETIKEGIFAMVESYIKDEEEEAKIMEKWKSQRMLTRPGGCAYCTMYKARTRKTLCILPY